MQISRLGNGEAGTNMHDQINPTLIQGFNGRQGSLGSGGIIASACQDDEGSRDVSGTSTDGVGGKKHVGQHGDLTLQDMYNKEGNFDDEDDSDRDPLESQITIVKWNCVNCTMTNLDDAIYCHICGEHKESEILRHGFLASPIKKADSISNIPLERNGKSAASCSQTSAPHKMTAVSFDDKMLLYCEVEKKSLPHPERPDRLRAIAASLATAVNLQWHPYHNICAWLEADSGNPREAPYVPIVEFLKNSDLFFALSTDVEISESWIRQFWSTAYLFKKFGEPVISASIEEQPVEVNEDEIRHALHLYDRNGIKKLDFEHLVRGFKKMGYQGDFRTKVVKKTLMYKTWRYLLHVAIHCLGARKGGYDEASSVLASGVLTMVEGKVFNWSHFIMQGMRYNLEEAGDKHKHLMYPRFLQIILNCQLKEANVNRGSKVIQLKHMQRSIFATCAVVSNKSAYRVVEVPLFGAIIEAPPTDGFGNRLVEEQPVARTDLRKLVRMKGTRIKVVNEKDDADAKKRAEQRKRKIQHEFFGDDPVSDEEPLLKRSKVIHGERKSFRVVDRIVSQTVTPEQVNIDEISNETPVEKVSKLSTDKGIGIAVEVPTKKKGEMSDADIERILNPRKGVILQEPTPKPTSEPSPAQPAKQPTQKHTARTSSALAELLTRVSSLEIKCKRYEEKIEQSPSKKISELTKRVTLLESENMKLFTQCMGFEIKIEEMEDRLNSQAIALQHLRELIPSLQRGERGEQGNANDDDNGDDGNDHGGNGGNGGNDGDSDKTASAKKTEEINQECDQATEIVERDDEEVKDTAQSVVQQQEFTNFDEILP